MNDLWTSAEAAAATGGQATAEWTASGVSIDSRSIDAGDLFFALRDQRDGHDFVAMALTAGAAAAVVTHRPADVPADAPLLIVADTLAALTALAAAARARSAASVVAVTGSVGKTGTKEMLRTALSALGKTHAAEKSYNNHWGVPLTLARMPRDADFAVIEIGMNAPGEIAPLARLARPHLALITTVAAVHLEAFEGIEGIAAEKASIAQGLEPDGVLLLNRDTDTYAVQVATARRPGIALRSFGRSAVEGDADSRLLSAHVTEFATTARASIAGQELMFRLGQPGAHLAENAVAVLAAVSALGGDVARAALELADWSAPEGRGARWNVLLGPGGIDGTIRLIDESYNANPAAMAAALEVFALTAPIDGVGRVNRGRRIAFLADMLELGGDGPALHAGLAQIPALEKVDLIHCAGPLMRALHDALPPRQRGVWCEDTSALAACLPRLVDAGDVVMCKGSNGSRVGLLVAAVKRLGQAEPEAAPRSE